MNDKNATYGIGTREKLAYAFGDFGGVLTFSLISSFLTMFYTDCLHLELAQITILMLVARVWDAVNDPIWGGIIDSRKPKKNGRFRPYVIGAAIPLAFAAVLMFLKVPGLTQTQYLIWAYVTYIFYGMMYTGVNIPYGSMASAITSDQNERSALSVWRSVGAGFGNIPSLVIMPLVVYTVVRKPDGSALLDTNGKVVKELDPGKLVIAVACIAAASLLIYLFHYKNTKERVQALHVGKKRSVGDVFTSVAELLGKNRPFVFLCLTSMFLAAFQMYTQSMYNYLYRYYFGAPGLYAIVSLSSYVPMALFLPFVGKLVRKYGKKELCAFGLAFATLINFLMYLIGFSKLSYNPYVFIVLLIFSSVGQTFFTFEVWAMVTDVINYHELKTNRREEGTAYSVFSFIRKLGQTLAGVGVPALLAVIGYNTDKNASTQSEQVISKMYGMSTLVPAIILFLMFILLTFGYSLSKNRTTDVYEELEDRNEREKSYAELK